ncbi:MAG: hypothetical protein IIW25_04585, partial [Bacteroidales bacterium]|nr:hypothetical protein [Bacteroidales bacterium]
MATTNKEKKYKWEFANIGGASRVKISKGEDIPVLVEGFAEDSMSDLLTNILHEQLNEFTAQQMKSRGI